MGSKRKLKENENETDYDESMFHIIKFDEKAITLAQSHILSKLQLGPKQKINSINKIISKEKNQNNRDSRENDGDKNEIEKAPSPGQSTKNSKSTLKFETAKTEPENAKCFKTLKNDKTFPLTKPNPMRLWFDLNLKNEVIINKRLLIKQELLECKSARNMFIKACKITIDNPLLETLIELYDREFFKGKFFQKLKQQSTTFILDIGDPSHIFQKGTAAFCRIEGDRVTIAFHKGINELKFKASYSYSDSRNKHPNVKEKEKESKMKDSAETKILNLNTCEEVNGILCYDKIDVLQIVLEHELIHLFHQVFVRKPNISHGPPFKELCKGLFGHTLYTHSIGHSRGLERVYEEEDRQQKCRDWRIKDLVQLTRLNYSSSSSSSSSYSSPSSSSSSSSFSSENENNLGMIVQLTKDFVTLMSMKGTLIEKIPFKELNKIEINDENKADHGDANADKNDSKSDSEVEYDLEGDDHDNDDNDNDDNDNNHNANANTNAKTNDTDNYNDKEGDNNNNKNNLEENEKKIEKDKSRMRNFTPRSKLLRWTNLFIKNKSSITKGSIVSYRVNKDTLVKGFVLSKKQSVAQIQISPCFIGLIPYHCLNIVE